MKLFICHHPPHCVCWLQNLFIRSFVNFVYIFCHVTSLQKSHNIIPLLHFLINYLDETKAYNKHKPRSKKSVEKEALDPCHYKLYLHYSNYYFILRISNYIMETILKPCSREAESEVEESMRFDKSLKELRELRSQLHNAAEHCETIFLKSKEKNDVVEHTKEYICRTVVTVVDHLGNASANLEGLISQTNAFSEAELRIQCLKQRLLSCEQYAHTVALNKMRWNENLPRFHSRYLSSPPALERSSKEKLSQIPPKTAEKHESETHEDLSLLVYTHKACSASNLKQATATVNGHNNMATVPNPSFHFQSPQKVVGRHRRSLHGSDILWRLRRSKRAQ